ncbi:DNA photolyase family protein [Thiotrichales bacterium 19S3-7]|nr:DNA photolyase family protein [Thiotrichales bacterium 19S3-7]MCF6801362.1 DNA photolyase family protein [Thiotrichales bacterium 19S3-11]
MVIVWIRQDLRLSDNPALSNAMKHDEVLPIYIDDTVHANEFRLGEASKVWLYYSLKKFNQVLDNKISFYQGDPLRILTQLITAYPIKKILWNRCYEPWQIKRDQLIKSKLTALGCEVYTYNGFLLWEPWCVLKKDHTPYHVFTAYYQKGALNAKSPRLLIDKPNLETSKLIKDNKYSQSLDQLKFLPKIKWYADVIKHWKVGEDHALSQLNDFLSDKLKSYKQSRDFPSLDATSKLSAALHFGEISVHTLWHRAKDCEESDGKAHFLKELAWREFAYHLLFYFNELPKQNWQKKFNEFPWSKDAERLNAWQRGQTGIPIVDAGMRQLWHTGHMHNRVRMICASFLIKNCMIDWREGQHWFWQCLFDADLANNSASWQWVAGCGFDAAPYFRIFNPVLQAEKFDPKGQYLKKYLPELNLMPIKYIYAPWLAPKEILTQANVELGKTYPYPIVDLKLSREMALEAYKQLG